MTLTELAAKGRSEAARLSGRPDYRSTVDLLDLMADSLDGAGEDIKRFGRGNKSSKGEIEMTQGDGYREDDNPFSGYKECGCIDLQDEQRLCAKHSGEGVMTWPVILYEPTRKMPEQKPFPKDIMFSTGKDNWQTPPEFFAAQHRKHQFTVDGAADSNNHLLPRWFGPGGEREDALEGEWPCERIWINPPYSIGAKFLDKAVEEVRAGRVERVVLLLPARTDTKAFHRCVWDKEKCQPREWVRELDLMQGRIKFVDPNSKLLRGTKMNGSNNSAPFPSMVLWFELGKWREDCNGG